MCDRHSPISIKRKTEIYFSDATVSSTTLGNERRALLNHRHTALTQVQTNLSAAARLSTEQHCSYPNTLPGTWNPHVLLPQIPAGNFARKTPYPLPVAGFWPPSNSGIQLHYGCCQICNRLQSWGWMRKSVVGGAYEKTISSEEEGWCKVRAPRYSHNYNCNQPDIQAAIDHAYVLDNTLQNRYIWAAHYDTTPHTHSSWRRCVGSCQWHRPPVVDRPLPPAYKRRHFHYHHFNEPRTGYPASLRTQVNTSTLAACYTWSHPCERNKHTDRSYASQSFIEINVAKWFRIAYLFAACQLWLAVDATILCTNISPYDSNGSALEIGSRQKWMNVL